MISSLFWVLALTLQWSLGWEDLIRQAEQQVASGRYAGAERLYRTALDGVSTAETDIRLPRTLIGLGGVQVLEGRTRDAEGSLRKALRLLRTGGYADRVETGDALMALAHLHRIRAEYAEAEMHYKSALGVYDRILGPGSHQSAVAHHGLGVSYRLEGQPRRAEPVLRKAVTIWRSAASSDPLLAGAGLSALADVYSDLHRYQESQQYHRQALELMEAHLGAGHPALVGPLTGFARLLVQTRDHAQAEALCRRALSIGGESLGTKHPDVAATLVVLAAAVEPQRRLSEAEAHLRRAAEILEPHDSVTYAKALNEYAALLRRSKRRGEARRLEARARSVLEHFRRKE